MKKLFILLVILNSFNAFSNDQQRGQVSDDEVQCDKVNTSRVAVKGNEEAQSGSEDGDSKKR